MVLVFQPLPSTAAELEGAAETQSPVRVKELMQFMEAEPLALGVEEVSGNLSHFCVASVASSYVVPTPNGGPRCCSQSGLTPLQAHRTALLKRLVIGEAVQDVIGLTKDVTCAAPMEGVIHLVTNQVVTRKFLQ